MQLPKTHFQLTARYWRRMIRNSWASCISLLSNSLCCFTIISRRYSTAFSRSVASVAPIRVVTAFSSEFSWGLVFDRKLKYRFQQLYRIEILFSLILLELINLDFSEYLFSAETKIGIPNRACSTAFMKHVFPKFVKPPLAFRCGCSLLSMGQTFSYYKLNWRKNFSTCFAKTDDIII